jgi:hypothetical protein
LQLQLVPQVVSILCDAPTRIFWLKLFHEILEMEVANFGTLLPIVLRLVESPGRTSAN